MSRTLISLAAMAALTVGAYAQAPAPTAPATPPAPAEKADAPTEPPTAQKADSPAQPAPAAKADTPPTDASAPSKPAAGDTANQETYKMKDGGMYQPPAQRPASPAMDTSIYGRT